MIKVIMTVGYADGSGQWTEDIFIDEESTRTSLEQCQEVISHFNDTLREGEKPRKLISHELAPVETEQEYAEVEPSDEDLYEGDNDYEYEDLDVSDEELDDILEFVDFPDVPEDEEGAVLSEEEMDELDSILESLANEEDEQ